MAITTRDELEAALGTLGANSSQSNNSEIEQYIKKLFPNKSSKKKQTGPSLELITLFNYFTHWVERGQFDFVARILTFPVSKKTTFMKRASAYFQKLPVCFKDNSFAYCEVIARCLVLDPNFIVDIVSNKTTSNKPFEVAQAERHCVEYMLIGRGKGYLNKTFNINTILAHYCTLMNLNNSQSYGKTHQVIQSLLNIPDFISLLFFSDSIEQRLNNVNSLDNAINLFKSYASTEQRITFYQQLLKMVIPNMLRSSEPLDLNNGAEGILNLISNLLGNNNTIENLDSEKVIDILLDNNEIFQHIFCMPYRANSFLLLEWLTMYASKAKHEYYSEKLLNLAIDMLHADKEKNALIEKANGFFQTAMRYNPEYYFNNIDKKIAQYGKIFCSTYDNPFAIFSAHTANIRPRLTSPYYFKLESTCFITNKDNFSQVANEILVNEQSKHHSELERLSFMYNWSTDGKIIINPVARVLQHADSNLVYKYIDLICKHLPGKNNDYSFILSLEAILHSVSCKTLETANSGENNFAAYFCEKLKETYQPEQLAEMIGLTSLSIDAGRFRTLDSMAESTAALQKPLGDLVLFVYQQTKNKEYIHKKLLQETIYTSNGMPVDSMIACSKKAYRDLACDFFAGESFKNMSMREKNQLFNLLYKKNVIAQPNIISATTPIKELFVNLNISALKIVVNELRSYNPFYPDSDRTDYSKHAWLLYLLKLNERTDDKIDPGVLKSILLSEPEKVIYFAHIIKEIVFEEIESSSTLNMAINKPICKALTLSNFTPDLSRCATQLHEEKPLKEIASNQATLFSLVDIIAGKLLEKHVQNNKTSNESFTPQETKDLFNLLVGYNWLSTKSIKRLTNKIFSYYKKDDILAALSSTQKTAATLLPVYSALKNYAGLFFNLKYFPDDYSINKWEDFRGEFCSLLKYLHDLPDQSTLNIANQQTCYLLELTPDSNKNIFDFLRNHPFSFSIDAIKFISIANRHKKISSDELSELAKLFSLSSGLEDIESIATAFSEEKNVIAYKHFAKDIFGYHQSFYDLFLQTRAKVSHLLKENEFNIDDHNQKLIDSSKPANKENSQEKSQLSNVSLINYFSLKERNNSLENENAELTNAIKKLKAEGYIDNEQSKSQQTKLTFPDYRN